MVGRHASIIVVLGFGFEVAAPDQQSSVLHAGWVPEKEFRMAMTDVRKLSVPERKELPYGQRGGLT